MRSNSTLCLGACIGLAMLGVLGTLAAIRATTPSAIVRLRDCQEQTKSFAWAQIQGRPKDWLKWGSLKEGDVIVGVDFSGPARGNGRWDALPPCFTQIASFRDTIEEVVVVGRDLTLEDISAISTCRHLTRLNANCVRLPDGALRVIFGSCPDLEVVLLADAVGDTDAGEWFRTASNVRTLGLTGANVGQDSLNAIGQLPNLRELVLTTCRLGDDEIRALVSGGCRSLELLDVSATNIGDGGMEALGQCSRLRDIRAGRNAGITEKGAERLGEMRQLERIDLFDVRMTDRALQAIATLPNLHELAISALNITDDGLLVIIECRSLRRLIIADASSISEETLATLRRRVPHLLVTTLP